MGLFLQRVQRSKIPHPTQRRFSSHQWEEEFGKIKAPDDLDKKLYEAGLWISERLERIRSEIALIHLNEIPRLHLLRLIIGELNRGSHIASRMTVVNEPGEFFVYNV